MKQSHSIDELHQQISERSLESSTTASHNNGKKLTSTTLVGNEQPELSTEERITSGYMLPTIIPMWSFHSSIVKG